MGRQIISTKKAPQAIGPYSQAVKKGNTLFTSGQIALDPDSMQVVDGGIEAQTVQVMKNLLSVLGAAGMTFGNVVKTTCYLSDMADFKAFNEVYATFFEEDNAPARATVAVKSLPLGVLVEIDAVAMD